ncbi:MAG TPA: hypothetical protein VM778_00020 [Gemmatimonadota bacterium]|nr:hypothetical protein [Gemmatimonadota bacterium]
MWWSGARRAPLFRRAAVAVAAATLAGVGGPSAARAQDMPAGAPGPIEIVLDASGSMNGRIGGREKMGIAKEFLLALRSGLSEEGDPPPMGLRVYGAGSHRLRRDCSDTRLLTRTSDPSEALLEDLEAVAPLGVSPLAYTLREAAADSARVYVLIADGGDNCEGDPCPVWTRAAARRGGPRLRLHVVAIGAEPDDLEGLRCLSRSSSGTFLTIDAPGEVASAAERLALIVRNEGVLDVRLSVAGEAFGAPVRMLRPLTGEVVRAFVARAARRVPAGMYTVVIETAPPDTLERVLVLPGERVEIERSDYGRLVVETAGTDGAPPVSVRATAGGPELRYGQAGQPVILRAGAYDVQVNLGDTLAIREGVQVSAGRTTRVVLGGTEPGSLRTLVPGIESPPSTRVLLYGEGRVDTLAVGVGGPVAPGSYRMVVQTLPPYFGDNVRIESGRETLVTLPETGVLGVVLVGPDGPIRGARITVREPMTGEAYGSFSSGERRLVMPATYRLEVGTAPPLTIDAVTVLPGEERIVERGGLSAVTLEAAAPERVRLELWTEDGARRLAEATGTRPVVAARPGTYLARVSRGTETVWQGRIAVAPGKTARIDWPGP